MDEIEQYEFDRSGYTIIKDMLGAGEVAAARRRRSTRWKSTPWPMSMNRRGR